MWLPDQTAPIGAVCSGSTLFASILNLSLMLGNYSADDIFRCIFFLSFNIPPTAKVIYRDGTKAESLIRQTGEAWNQTSDPCFTR